MCDVITAYFDCNYEQSRGKYVHINLVVGIPNQRYQDLPLDKKNVRRGNKPSPKMTAKSPFLAVNIEIKSNIYLNLIKLQFSRFS